MIADIDKYVDFLTENKITEHQFLILWLVHTKDNNNIRKYKQSFGQFNTDQVIDLVDRGWIDDFGTIKDNKIEFNIYNYVVTDEFVKKFIIDEEDAYHRLIAIYPRWFIIKGIKFPTVTGDPLKISKEYAKYHKGNKLATDRVEKITKLYFEKNPIAIAKIENYVLNRMWNLFEDEAMGTKDAFQTI